MKKKPIVRTVVDVKSVPGRGVDASAGARQAYPRADLISRDPEWRRWLADALRAVVGPAALAGAVGIAAAGCNGAGMDQSTANEDASTAAWMIESDKLGDPPCHTVGGIPCNSGVSMQPLGPSDKPPVVDPTTLVPQNVPPPVNPPVLDGDVPYVRPPVHPPQVRGGVRAIAPRPDIPMPGGLRPALPGDVDGN